MKTIKTIAKNISLFFIALVTSAILEFFSYMYIARYFGVEGFGILSFALALTAIVSIFVDSGLRQLMVREVARNNSLAEKYLWNITGIKLFLIIAAYSLLILFIYLLSYTEITIKVIYFIAFANILKAFSQNFYGIFQAYERMEYESLGRILESALHLIGALFVISYGFSLVYLSILYALASLIILVFNYIISMLKFVKPRLEIDWYFWKTTIKEAIPFGLSLIFVTIIYWTSSVMLSLIKGNAEVGWYNAAYRIVLVLLFIPTVFTTGVYPVMAKFFKTSEESMRLSYNMHFKYMVILGIPSGVGITLLAQKIILLIFGVEYTNSIIALQILVWSSVLIFISQPIGNLFCCVNEQKIVAKVNAICVVLNLALNLILIPKYGIIGASIATVFTEFISLTFLFVLSIKINYGIKKELINITMKVFVSSTLMGLFILFSYGYLNIFIQSLFAVLFYFIVLFMLKGVDKKDVDLVKLVLLGDAVHE